MTPTVETLSFQAEVKELLGLMIHSLYSHREIFLRELVSNASDALDKLRVEALANEALRDPGHRPHIRLEIDTGGRVLAIRDNGIGMSREELVANLGTIASSGTRKFLDRLRERGRNDVPELIGQFGVGFYSSFMVADEVVVETRRAGEATGWRWRSKGDGAYTLEELPDAPLGTRVELRLKPPADDGQDFAQPNTIAALIRRYSDFVAHPIEMAAAHFKDRGDLKKSTASDGLEVVTLNSQRPIWTRSKDEIEPREYAEFYRHLTHDFDEPAETIHFKAEGASEYVALLYVPSERTFDLFDPHAPRSRVALYVRRVLVMEECEEIVPPWMRFLRGLVDSSDLPLNVSREILQRNRTTAQIRKRVIRKVLDALKSMLETRRADYERFWKAYGSILKEALLVDPDEAEAVRALALHDTSRGAQPTTLDEYVERMPAEQKEIYALFGLSRQAVERSPHLEALRAKGFEVLLLTEPIDEWVLDRFPTYKEKPVRAIDRGEFEALDPLLKETLESSEREQRELLESLETELKPAVTRVRFSARLTDSAAVLVDEPHALGRHMERMMRETGREVPPRGRILELNPAHPVVRRLIELRQGDPQSPRARDFVELLHGQALLAEGSPLPDPQRFSKLVGDLMLTAGQ